jgi:hypothetical protein
MGSLKQTIWQVWVAKMRRWYSKTATWSGCVWRRFVMVVGGSSQLNILIVPYHGGGRSKKINAWYLNTLMVFL